MKYNALRAALLLSAAVLAPHAASAQEAEAAPAAEEGTFGEDIVVTARRREESLQSVPVAVTALSGESLAKAGIVQLQDIQTKTPGLRLQPSSYGSSVLAFTIRGQRQAYPFLTADPSVWVYFAEVPMARPHGLNGGLYDLRSVQVLKGPQGTLFGRNSTGGALLLEPARPNDEWEGYMKLGVGNYALMTAEGAINIPVSDRLQIRAAGQLTRRDGYTKNIDTGLRYDDQESESWRVSIRALPTDTIENRLVLFGYHDHSAPIGYRMAELDPNGPAVKFFFPGLVAEQARLAQAPFHSTTSENTEKTKVRSFGLSNITEIQLGDDLTLKNVFGYRKIKSRVFNDYDGSSEVVFAARERLNADQFSNELQLSGSSLADQLKWIVGGFWFRESGLSGQTNYSIYQQTDFFGNAVNTSKSVFGQATFRPAGLQSVSLTGGARYTWDTRKWTARSRQLSGTCALVDAAGVPLADCVRSLSPEFKKLSYELTADWKPIDEVLLYVTHRKGYRSGGFSLGATSPTEFLPYKPETVKDVEVGFKAQWRVGDVRMRLNTAAYEQKYKDIQRATSAFQDGAYRNPILNAARATIRGAEAELSIEPVQGIQIDGFVGYLDPKYDEYVNPLGVDLSNNKFGNAPKWTAGGSVEVSLLDSDAGRISARGDVYYQSSSAAQDTTVYDGTDTPLPGIILPSYTTANARLEWAKIGGTPITATIWARNLTDEKYYSGGTVLYQYFGINGKFAGAPRTYGFELTWDF